MRFVVRDSSYIFTQLYNSLFLFFGHLMSSPSDLFVSKMKFSSIQSVAYSTGFEKSLDTAMVVEFSGPFCCGDDNRGLAHSVVGAINVDSYVPGLKAANARCFFPGPSLLCCAWAQHYSKLSLPRLSTLLEALRVYSMAI